MERKRLEDGRIWTFVNERGDGEFLYPDADSLWRVYFPLCNFAGMKSAVTMNFKGDVKTGQNTFLTVPVSVEDLHSCHWSRNFWVAAGDKAPWSATGVGTTYLEDGQVVCTARGGPGWLVVSRRNEPLGLEADVSLFVPPGDLAAEVMIVTVKNVGAEPVVFQPTYCVPAYCRSADNLRSHRHVTSLLNRVEGLSHGFRFKPSMNFDERGHRLNAVSYFVLGFEQDGSPPVGGWADLAEFCGPRFGLDRPDAVFKKLAARSFSEKFADGRESVGALRFADKELSPGEEVSFTIVLAVAEEESPRALFALGKTTEAAKALEGTRKFWGELLDGVKLTTGDGDFDQWFRWVQLQPFLRKIFGNSFLPDVDYGRGGRGWRDLWQDLLGTLLTDPAAARAEMVSYFAGIRWDGSNATIIGERAGEFIADRDNISRVWMDHGVWPWMTLKLFIDRTGDTSILFEKARYWKDHQLRRARARDEAWRPEDGTWQKDRGGRIVEGTVLEHVLLQHYVAFFHVGEHDIMLLEGADWNDGIDMARTRGESVHFTGVYAANMKTLADVLEHVLSSGLADSVDVAAELARLMRLGDESMLSGWKKKREHLDAFFDSVAGALSGERASVKLADLIADLRVKAESIFDRIRRQEWVTTGDGESFFNAYYDERGVRVDGDTAERGTQMNLAAQAMLLLAGVPDEDQIDSLLSAVGRYLGGHVTGLPALCTDTKGPYMELGRNFGYAYGNKENGAPFSHMNVMYAAGLFDCGRPREGWDVLRKLYESSMMSARSRMLPGIPEYFEPDGRGVYCYLTGSAAWYVLTTITRLVGVKGRLGDLELAPRMAAAGLSPDGWSLEVPFAGRVLHIRFAGRGEKIQRLDLNGAEAKTSAADDGRGVLIRREIIEALAADRPVSVDVKLG